jgi:energy-coupling factor transport system permease protein
MRSALAYAPRPGPLGEAAALAATLFLLAPAVVAFASSNPIVLVAAGLAAGLAGRLGGAWSAVLAALRWAVALGVLIVAVNVLASQRGDTILVRGWELPLLGHVDVSAEALAEGGVLALRIAVVLIAFAVHTACVDPDRLLRLLRPLARRSALTATLIVRMAPLAARDHARLREAAGLRGPAAAPVDRPATVRRLVAGALDRAIEAAATLELRGYAASPRRRRGRPRRRSRHDGRLALAGLVIIAAGAGARLSGHGGFEAYPLVSIDAGPATLAVGLLLPVAAAAPFALARIGVRATTTRREPTGGEARA